ncbi:hypothetical protein TWF594_008940 [Orbilia oligospora]|nr:hypothetical protein TWF594_008940 [Orbilia oligospora]
MDPATSKIQVPGNNDPGISTNTGSSSPSAPTNTNSDGSAAPINTKFDEPAKPTLPRRITDKVVIPVIALGLATPIISQGICLVGSKILKHRMDRETEAMMARARAGGSSNIGRGDPIALSKDEENMRKAEMSAIKEHFKRRKEDAKVQRRLLKAEKAAIRKNGSIFAQKLKKKPSPSTTSTTATATAAATIDTANGQPVIQNPDPPTYSEAISRVDNLVPEWGQSGPSTLPFQMSTTPINPNSATNTSAPSKCKGILNWAQEKKSAAYQGLKLGQKKAAFKTKVKVTKKAGLIFAIGGIGDKMTSRGFLMSALGTSTFGSLPSLIMPFLGGAMADPMIFGTITSGLIIVISAIGSIVVYIKSRQNSRRAIEKSAFGRILTDKERKERKPEYKNAKLKAKLDKKAEQAQLKAEEKELKSEQAKLKSLAKAEAKLLKKQTKQVKKETLQKKITGLPLKIVLGGVKFLNILAVEIPKASVPDVPTDAVPGAVQGDILPTEPTDVVSLAKTQLDVGEASEKLPSTGLDEAEGKLPETALGEVDEKLSSVDPQTGPVAPTPLGLNPTTQPVPITPITSAPGSTPMPITPI